MELPVEIIRGVIVVVIAFIVYKIAQWIERR